MTTTIRAESPIDGRWLGDYAVTESASLPTMVTRGRVASKQWEALSPAVRSKRLAPLQSLVMAKLDDLCDCIVASCGKVRTEALLGEIYPVLDLANYYRRHAAGILKDQSVATSPMRFPSATAGIHYRPLGVVAIIAPWNYPFQLSMIPILTALHAGNAVILKPSERCLPVAMMIMDLLADLQLPDHLVQSVLGDADQAKQLIDARPDMVFFTGGTAGGRAVMARASQHPIPVILELGGKDAMIVLEDADLARASRAALYGAFCNSGQVCVSVERLYVHQSIYAELLAKLRQGLETLSVGHETDASDMGSMTTLDQFFIVESLYHDAIAKGAKASSALERHGQTVRPVLLWDVRHDMRIMREECFGPILAIMPFNTDEEALRLANDSCFGLNASLWSRDEKRAKKLAAQLEVGNWAINDVLKNVGHPGLPFGGVKQSGFGRYHGAEGLLSFSQTVSGLISHHPKAGEPNWFPYSSATYRDFSALLDLSYGPSALPFRIARNLGVMAKMLQKVSFSHQQLYQNIKCWLRGH